MASSTTTIANSAGAAGTTTESSKRNFAFNAGLEKMKDANILKTSGDKLADMASTISANPDLAFDMLYVNMPWKVLETSYAAGLPIAKLIDPKNAGLLMWVDSPNIVDATTILDKWGFRFHSVLHVTSYANPSTTSNTTETTPNDDTPPDTDETAVENAASAASAAANAKVAPKKAVAPTGWNVQGIVPSRTRQLWFAVKGDDTNYLKDASFIRKRLPATSIFEFTNKSSTTLSSKKKNLDQWVLYPEYAAYVPEEIEAILGTIHKANARVLSLFSETLNRNWYTWGPNVPGYVACPMRPDGGFSITNAFLKYFGAMKGATVQKYLTLMNLYAVQSAKQIGFQATGSKELDEDGNPKVYLTPLVTGRMKDFCEDVVRRYEEAGGIQENALSGTSLVFLDTLKKFGEMDPVIQTQVLVLVARIIQGVMQKHALSSERRKRAIKRKRDVSDEGEKTPRSPRKFGIAAPVDISEDLCKFLGMVPGEKVARTTVVKQINDYIRSNNLQNPQRRSEILCDDKLKKLLNPGPNFVVNYFNLCKLLGPHFKKSAKGMAAEGKAREETTGMMAAAAAAAMEAKA